MSENELNPSIGDHINETKGGAIPSDSGIAAPFGIVGKSQKFRLPASDIALAPTIEAQLTEAVVNNVGGPSVMCRIKPRVIVALAECYANKDVAPLKRSKRKLLARVGGCQFATELYLEAKASILGKKIAYVSGGLPLEDVPIE